MLYIHNASPLRLFSLSHVYDPHILWYYNRITFNRIPIKMKWIDFSPLFLQVLMTRQIIAMTKKETKIAKIKYKQHIGLQVGKSDLFIQNQINGSIFLCFFFFISFDSHACVDLFYDIFYINSRTLLNAYKACKNHNKKAKLVKKIKVPFTVCRCNVKIDILKWQWIELIEIAKDSEKKKIRRYWKEIVVLVFSADFLFLNFIAFSISFRDPVFLPLISKWKIYWLIDSIRLVGLVLKISFEPIRCGLLILLFKKNALKICVNIHLNIQCIDLSIGIRIDDCSLNVHTHKHILETNIYTEKDRVMPTDFRRIS